MQITTHYNSGMQNSISEHTTCQTSKWIGYCSRRPINLKNKSNKYLMKGSLSVNVSVGGCRVGIHSICLCTYLKFNMWNLTLHMILVKLFALTDTKSLIVGARRVSRLTHFSSLHVSAVQF